MKVTLNDIDSLMDAYLRLQSGIYIQRLLEVDAVGTSDTDFHPRVNADAGGYVSEALVQALQDMRQVLDRIQANDPS